ncbi:hypothetical protein [Hyphomicrobium sp.]|uniref:hypothetical protein n=1 Tax=Hyphomicrobium sp. TaxID=82 RepID=UPI002FDF902E
MIDQRKWHPLALVLGATAILFGILTVISGGRVLFGNVATQAAAGAVIPFVLWFNFAAGFAYVAAGFGLMARKRWAVWLSIVIATATVLVFAAFGVHVWSGGAYELRTVGAMSLRSSVWVGIAAVASRLAKF